MLFNGMNCQNMFSDLIILWLQNTYGSVVIHDRSPGLVILRMKSCFIHFWMHNQYVEYVLCNKTIRRDFFDPNLFDDIMDDINNLDVNNQK